MPGPVGDTDADGPDVAYAPLRSRRQVDCSFPRAALRLNHDRPRRVGEIDAVDRVRIIEIDTPVEKILNGQHDLMSALRERDEIAQGTEVRSRFHERGDGLDRQRADVVIRAVASAAGTHRRRRPIRSLALSGTMSTTRALK